MMRSSIAYKWVSEEVKVRKPVSYIVKGLRLKISKDGHRYLFNDTGILTVTFVL